MAAAFRPVNVNSPSPTGPLASAVSSSVTASEAATTTAGGDVMTPSPAPAPSTPRPSTAPGPAPAPQHHDHDSDDHLITPTRSTFSPSIASRQQYPASVYSDSTMASGGADPSKQSTSHQRDSMEMDIDDDGSPAGTDDGAASDDESVNADGTRSNKKKKSQRFYCTDYPPCSLSFTRSEHLARHIRKHTGERPFQCHCSRRFSRLDNLRQHAQTVHVNEDIPIDSLAATGSRFQRQMRTDRVRQAGNRARASTSGSAGGPPRGHSKSLSTSSINSVASVASNNYSTAPDPRRRPPPLVMADPRRPVDPYRTSENPFAYRPASPSEFSTPTSATFSTGQNSPRWSGMPSPSLGHSRSQSMYTPDGRTHARRLSVPSAAPPFQHMPGRPMFGGAGPMNSSNGGAFSPAASNMVASPTASHASGWSRRESTSSAADEAWRRRTWHPESPGYSSGHGHSLSNASAYSSINPDPRPPMAKPNPNGQSTLQLPGIESFDQQSQAPVTPPARRASPMMVDPAPRPPTLHSTPRDMAAPEDRRNLNLYDASMHRGPQRPEYGPNTPPREIGAWAHETSKAVQQAQMENPRGPAVRFEGPPPTSYPAGGPVGAQGYHQQTMSAPSVATSRASKRRAWYHGPAESHREEGRPAQDPRVARVERMVHPNFAGFPGIPMTEQQQGSSHHQQQQQPPKEGSPESLRRLEALVAVATSEGSKTATAY